MTIMTPTNVKNSLKCQANIWTPVLIEPRQLNTVYIGLFSIKYRFGTNFQIFDILLVELPQHGFSDS